MELNFFTPPLLPSINMMRVIVSTTLCRPYTQLPLKSFVQYLLLYVSCFRKMVTTKYQATITNLHTAVEEYIQYYSIVASVAVCMVTYRFCEWHKWMPTFVTYRPRPNLSEPTPNSGSNSTKFCFLIAKVADVTTEGVSWNSWPSHSGFHSPSFIFCRKWVLDRRAFVSSYPYKDNRGFGTQAWPVMNIQWTVNYD